MSFADEAKAIQSEYFTKPIIMLKGHMALNNRQ